jgi:hypothetical protein
VALVARSGTSVTFTRCILSQNTAGNDGGVAYVYNTGSSLTLRDSTTTNNTVKGDLYAFYVSSILTIINPHPSSQTDLIRGDPFQKPNCTHTPCNTDKDEECTSAAPVPGVYCSASPIVHTVSCGGSSNPTGRQVRGCSTTGTLSITFAGLFLDDLAFVTVGAGACSVDPSSTTSTTCTVAADLLWGSAEVRFCLFVLNDLT